jgi:hypothetical protein
MTRLRYLLGVLVVIAIWSALSYMKTLPRPEEPMPERSGGGVLDLHGDELLRAAEFESQANKPLPAKK